MTNLETIQSTVTNIASQLNQLNSQIQSLSTGNPVESTITITSSSSGSVSETTTIKTTASAPTTNIVSTNSVATGTVFNSIDGPITSGGNNPVLGSTFACTTYDIIFPESGSGTISYIACNGKANTFTFTNRTITDNIASISVLNNVKLVEKKLLFQIPAESPAPKFVTVPLKVVFPAKRFRVYFGTPSNPEGSINWFNGGSQTATSRYGVTLEITATQFWQLDNVRLVDLNPEIPIPPPTTTSPSTTTNTTTSLVGTFNSIDGVIKSGGNNPLPGSTFACTSYDIIFPATGSGTISYTACDGAVRNYTFTNMKFPDNIRSVISSSNVQLIEKKLLFRIPAETPAPTFVTVPLFTTFPARRYKVYIGTPNNPTGTVNWYNGTVQTSRKLVGETIEITATRFIQLDNVRLVDLGLAI